MDDKTQEAGSTPNETSGLNPLRMMTSRRKKIVLGCLALNTLLLNMCLSVVGPVFPIEVRKVHPKHDAKAGFAIGMVFSVATITDFLSSPLVGRDLPRLGAKRMFGLGTFLVSGVMLLFSSVSKLYDWNYFLAFCYMLRISQGVGTAMVFVSTFSLLVGTFPDNVAAVSGMLEVFTGLGFMIGPALGGILYEYGGFTAPFLSVGSALLLGTIAIQCLLPNSEASKLEEGSFPASTIIFVPRAFLMFIVAFWTSAALAFFDPTLGPFLHEGFKLSPSKVGACFLISPGTYMILAPIVGYIADNFTRKPLIPIGCFIAALGYELMGPKTLFGLSAKLSVILVGFVLVGVGVAFAFIPVSADILDTMRKKGYEDTPELHGAIGGLLGSSFSLGLTVGPLIGGTLSGSFNFGDASALFGLLYVLLGVVVTLQTMWLWCCKKYRNGVLLASDEIPLTKINSKSSR